MSSVEVPQLAARLHRTKLVPLCLPTPYPVGPVWVYLLRGEPLTLIDTGPRTRAAWESLKKQLAAFNLRPQDLERVLITHGHHDHMGLARRFQGYGARVYAHRADRNNLALRRSFRRLNQALAQLGVKAAQRLRMFVGLWLLDQTSLPLKEFVPLQDGQELDYCAGPIRVHHLPGHSPGHLAFQLPEGELWISGDALLAGKVPTAVLEPDPDQPERVFPALSVYRQTLVRLSSSPPQGLLPAHGPAILEVVELARTTLAKQQQRSQLILTHLPPQGCNLPELLATLYPTAAGLRLFLAYSELFGHLLHLQQEGLVRAEPSPRGLRFHRT
ncbi:MAG: MBL fold metallo-hydrolase [Thermoanaerobaculum sp.]|nr:MBL fold metallo-hydrolase [Thermoanaerobaculum sp.]